MSRIVGMSYEKLFEKLASKDAEQILEVMEPFFQEVATIDSSHTCTFFVDQLRFDPETNVELLLAAAEILSTLVHGIETRKSTAQYVTQLFRSFLAALSKTALHFEGDLQIPVVQIEDHVEEQLEDKDCQLKKKKCVTWNDNYEVHVIDDDEIEVVEINDEDEDQESSTKQSEPDHKDNSSPETEKQLRQQIEELTCNLGLAHKHIAELEKQNVHLVLKNRKFEEKELKTEERSTEPNRNNLNESAATIAELQEKVKRYAFKARSWEEHGLALKKRSEEAVKDLKEKLKSSQENYETKFKNVLIDLEAERRKSHQLQQSVQELKYGQRKRDSRDYCDYRNERYNTKRSRPDCIVLDDSCSSSRNSNSAVPVAHRVLLQRQ